MARRAGWKVNNKRIRRLWRNQGLQGPQRRKKKRLTGIGVAVGAMSPIRPNVIWAMDFPFDTTADGRTLNMLNVIDEFTREALAINVDRSIDADGVVGVLDPLALQPGAPTYLRFDNGPEFVAQAVNDWCRFNGAGSLFIDPGSHCLSTWFRTTVCPGCWTHWLIGLFEVLLQTGAIVGLVVVRQSLCCRSKVLRVASSCAVAGSGMNVVVAARPHGDNVSDISSRGALNIDRRHAGRWDREQLIGGKPIEARK
jgi:Integrase core domain